MQLLYLYSGHAMTREEQKMAGAEGGDCLANFGS